MKLNEKRRGERVAFQVCTTLDVEGKKIRSDETRDLSVGGVFVFCEETLPLGVPCRVKVQLTGQSSQLILKMQGRVARCEPGTGIAIEFTALDLDCYTFLKNVVEYNRATEGNENPEGFDNSSE